MDMRFINEEMDGREGARKDAKKWIVFGAGATHVFFQHQTASN